MSSTRFCCRERSRVQAAILAGEGGGTVVVNDRMQRGYVYYRTEPTGRNFAARLHARS